mgnify:CR=1 FL=1
MKFNLTKRKKALALLTSMVIAAGMAGCAENANINSSVNGVGFESNVYSAENKSNMEEKTDVVVKKELNSANENHVETAYEITDWSLENLLENITLCGESFSLPCCISEVKNFSVINLDSGDGSSQYISSAGGLVYNDKEVAVVGFKNEITDDNFNNAEINTLILQSNNGALPTFNIMGITEKSTREDVVKILGEPNYNKNDEDGRVYRYVFSNTSAFMIIFEKDNADVIKSVFIMNNM